MMAPFGSDLCIMNYDIYRMIGSRLAAPLRLLTKSNIVLGMVMNYFKSNNALLKVALLQHWCRIRFTSRPNVVVLCFGFVTR
jgi:hypothetical protein